MKELEFSTKLFNKEFLNDKHQLFLEIENARMDWFAALSYFQYAKRWDEIDLAIFKLNTSEQLYSILLRQAKEADLTVAPSVYEDSPLRFKYDGNEYHFFKNL